MQKKLPLLTLLEKNWKKLMNSISRANMQELDLAIETHCVNASILLALFTTTVVSQLVSLDFLPISKKYSVQISAFLGGALLGEIVFVNHLIQRKKALFAPSQRL